MRGIWSAVLTPVDAAFRPDARVAIPYYRELLADGCDGLNVLGTTGEAMSFGVERRLEFMEAVAGSGLPMERVMVGTGAASLDDAVRLTRSAVDLRFRAALVMPPFFFRDASNDGIVAFFDALFERVRPPAASVLLYNFPRMSGIAFRLPLLDRLVERSGAIIAGMKDSSNDATLQAEVVHRFPGFAVLPGSEADLLEAKARGASGCISGSVALWPQLAAAAWRDDDPAAAVRLRAQRAALDGYPFVAAVRHRTAALRAQPQWERAMPPNVALESEDRTELDRGFSAAKTP